MDTFMAVVLALALSGCGTGQEESHVAGDLWSNIQLLAEPDTREQNRELLTYIKSLTPEELLAAARQGCIAGENKRGLTLDWERDAAAESNALLCLGLYFDVMSVDENGRKRLNVLIERLIVIAADKEELLCLRRVVVNNISYGRNTRLHDMFSTYASNSLPKVERLLSEIIKDEHEATSLRKDAMSGLRRAFDAQVRMICSSDVNVREGLEEKRKHTKKVVRVTELIRSGEVTLTEETLRALKPVAARILANVRLLGTILADEGNEPADLRKQAKRTLEAYRRSALTQVDDEVDKALGEGDD